MSLKDKSIDDLLTLLAKDRKDPRQMGALTIEDDIIPAMNRLAEGDILNLQRPVVTLTGAIQFIERRAKVVKKYPNWFLVEDVTPFGIHSRHKRRWGVQYTDLIKESWYERKKFDMDQPV